MNVKASSSNSCGCSHIFIKQHIVGHVLNGKLVTLYDHLSDAIECRIQSAKTFRRQRLFSIYLNIGHGGEVNEVRRLATNHMCNVELTCSISSTKQLASTLPTPQASHVSVTLSVPDDEASLLMSKGKLDIRKCTKWLYLKNRTTGETWHVIPQYFSKLSPSKIENVNNTYRLKTNLQIDGRAGRQSKSLRPALCNIDMVRQARGDGGLDRPIRRGL